MYPDQLVAAVVERSLGPDVLGAGGREALAGRGDDLAVHDLLTRAGHAVFGAVLALNGVYSPHRMIKWQSHLTGELDVLPEQFAERLRLLWTSGTAQALREAETLITNTVQLVQARTDADISSFCEELSQRRRASTRRPLSTGLLPRNVLHGARSGNLTLTERTLRTAAMCASITHGDAARTIIAA